MKILRKLAVAGAIGLGVNGAANAEWTRAYVMEWGEAAFYYGAESGIVDPGTDCPAGTNGEPNWEKVFLDAGYSQQETDWLLDPTHPFRVPGGGQNQMAFRGKDRQNVYMNPESTPDPGLVGVTGTIGEGVDLDGDATNGFTSPDGKTTGIDNNYYKALGCWKTHRGPERMSYTGLRQNGGMRDGAWTTAIVVHGEGDDPLNDENVTVAIYDSKDVLIKDGDDGVARDYSFRVSPDVMFEAIMKAKTVDGVIVTPEPAKEIWMRGQSYVRELQLLQAQLQLEMKPDGSLRGYIAGYRPWEYAYYAWVGSRGPIVEVNTWIELPGMYYSLRRNADYSPEGPEGEKTHISYALRVDAVPAYVLTPDAKEVLKKPVSYKSIAPPEPRILPWSPSLPEFSARVKDGVTADPDGVILAGPDVTIPPPRSMTDQLASNDTGAE